VKDSRIAPPEVHAPAKEPCCSKGARRRTHNRHRLVATTLHLNLLKMAQIRRSSRRLRRACVRGYLPPRRFSRAGARSHHEITHCARRPLALAARRPIVRAFADIRIAGRLGGPSRTRAYIIVFLGSLFSREFAGVTGLVFKAIRGRDGCTRDFGRGRYENLSGAISWLTFFAGGAADVKAKAKGIGGGKDSNGTIAADRSFR
jgi:hypothetical protein